MQYKDTKKSDTIYHPAINFLRNGTISNTAAENTTDTQHIAYWKRRKKFLYLSPNLECAGGEVQYGSAVQLDWLLCGVVHNALYCVMMGQRECKPSEKVSKTWFFPRRSLYSVLQSGTKGSEMFFDCARLRLQVTINIRSVPRWAKIVNSKNSYFCIRYTTYI